MSHGVAKVYQAAFGQQDHAAPARERDFVDLRLDVVPLQVLQACDLNFVVEVADVADDGTILHRPHVLDGDDVLVAGRGDEDVGARRGVFHGDDFVAFHRGLQRTDRIDLRHHDAAAGLAQRRGRAFADVAEARDHRDLAGHHHVGAAADAVDQRLAAAVEIVELRLGDAVVDVDRREQQRAFFLHLVEPVHAGGRLLRDALDRFRDLAEPAFRFVLQRLLEQREHDFLFLDARLVEERRVTVLGAQAEMHEHRGVAAVVEDHVRHAAAVPFEQLAGVVPIVR